MLRAVRTLQSVTDCPAVLKHCCYNTQVMRLTPGCETSISALLAQSFQPVGPAPIVAEHVTSCSCRPKVKLATQYLWLCRSEDKGSAVARCLHR